MTATAVMEEAPRTAIRLEQEALTVPQEARLIVVLDQVTLNLAGAMLTDRIKPLRKEAAAVFEPIKKAAHEAHKAACAGLARVEAPLIEAEDILKRSISTYTTEQERLRRIEEDRLRKEAWDREQAEMRAAEERRRAEEIALNEQIAREHAEEMERQIEALPADAPIEQMYALCDAPAPEPVHIAPEMPVFAPTPVAAARFVAPTGVSTSQKWKAEVTDLRVLCRAIADGRIPVHYVEANMTVLNGLARANKQALNIPGVKAVADTTVSARSR